MNAKKKNKKANKPSNPNPPQNVEKVQTKEEKVEELAPKCEVKAETLPPIVCSEVAEKPVSENKEIEGETPKKPKRNKGKNKKPEKEEKVEVEGKLQEMQTEFIPKVGELIQKVAIADEEFEKKEDLLGETNVVPSARKKKNKKKTQEKSAEEIKTTVDDNNTTLLKEPTIEHLEKIDTEIQELFSSKPETPKQEGKKKKNKKKNRTDSERSESDNVISCTSAFQNILGDNTFKSEKPDNTVETKDDTTDLILKVENIQTENIVKSIVETKTPAELKEMIVDSEETKELPKNENKGKKKNKKDKKQHQKETINATKLDIPEEISIPTEDVLTETLISIDPNQIVKESMDMPFDIQKDKEPSPKPKAKIAKPVEKKPKEKLEARSSENLISVENLEKTREDVKPDELSKKCEIESEKTPAINIFESEIEVQLKSQTPATSSLFENIDVPPDQAMGKKRKKSPKPHKIKDNNNKSNVELDTEKLKSEVTYESKKSTEITLDPVGQVVFSEPIIEMPLKSPDDIPEKSVEQNEHIIDLTQMKLLERPLTPEIKKDNEGFETKTSKKKKKTPKIPQAETTLEVKEPTIEITKTTDQKQMSEESKPISDEQISKEQAKVPLEIYLASDIVRSLATGSEASSCDLVPDVHFNRSFSQQLLDSNNNTVIQEVINVEEIKFDDQQLTPVIEGSGETPAHTPDPVSSGIRMSEIETKIPIEEKTDIKSKMMEVNQDMEELRLSIERSLAEFTSLEKTDKELEKKSEVKKKNDKKSVKDGKKDEKYQEKTVFEVKENISEALEMKEPEKTSQILTEEIFTLVESPPVCPTRKDNKGKNKSKKKGKQEMTTATATATSESSTSQSKDSTKDEKKEESEKKTDQKSESSQEKGKQQTAANDGNDATILKDTNNEKYLINSELISDATDQTNFEPIENFEDALTSSIDDVNKTFEMIAKDADNDNVEFQKKLAANKPEINITAAEETDTNRNEKVNPVSQPKNLLGHTDIPVQSNRTDYKKEKNKTPNARQARVKIKDSMDIESKKQSKEVQTDSKSSRKISDISVKESFSRVKNDNEEYVYKYSFRKVFLQSACHVCNRDLKQVRVPCGYCNLIFYCGVKHKDEDWPQHQALCFAVSTLAHMKDQKHIYADAANVTGQDYRLLRMQMIVSCEKVLKRRLVPWEQEVMLYPRMCADVACREWRQGKLKDCDGCGQLSFCAAHPEHLPKVHSRWCKSYSLYQKLVSYQQTKGRLEPRLPTKVMSDDTMPGKMNEVLASMYEEKIDMNDVQYAALTQLATAPLTTAYCLQLSRSATNITNGVHKKYPFTIHVVGAELQFEADALNKWETFFLHLRPDVEELRVVLVSPQLNPGNLPLNLLGRIKLCDNCYQNKRRVVFKFEDNKNYFEYRSSEEFINPDIICAFNPSIQRSSMYNGKDPWPASINTMLKLKTPFIITSYTLNELRKDITRIKQVSEIDFKLISEPGFNNFASVRPDRNFISDDEIPLLFKNYCVAVVLGC